MSDVFEKAGEEPATQQETTPAQEEVTTERPTPVVEYNGKQWTPEEILNKFKSADQHISQIEEENRTLAEKVAKAVTLEEVAARLDTTTETSTQTEPTTAPVAEVDVEAVAMNAYQKIRQQEIFEANIQASNEKLSQAYGEKAADVLISKSKELGMTIDEAKDLAARKPRVFESLFLVGGKSETVAMTTGSVNTQTLRSSNQPSTPISKMKNRDLVQYALEVAKKL